MQCDEDFNTKFVTIVKKYKCIYDKRVPDYRNKDEQEKAWVEIALQAKESISHCKERWRNLRACLSRYIKQQSSPDAQHKPYYLTDHMKFLLPFLKPSRSSGSGHMNFESNVKNSDADDTTNEQDFLDNHKYDYNTKIDEGNSILKIYPITPKRSLSETDTASINCVPDVQIDTDYNNDESDFLISTFNDNGSSKLRKKIKIENTNQQISIPTCPDMDFFKSILPDIRTLTPQQKRKFKIGILELIDEVIVKYPTENRTNTGASNELNNAWKK